MKSNAEAQWLPVPSARGGSGNFAKWSDLKAGAVVTGKFTGVRDGKFGKLVDLQRPDDGTLVTYPAPTVLERQLAEVRVGGLVRIEYQGKVNGKAGQSFHSFITSV